MFIKRILTAAVMAAFAISFAEAAEFAKGPASTTVELQKAAVEMPVPATVDMSPSAKANAWLEKVGMRTGPNEKILPDGTKEVTVINIGVYRQKANSRTVSAVRAIGTMTAQLNAKAELVKFLNTTVDANIRSSIPKATKLETEFDRQKAQLEEELTRMLGEYEEALQELNGEKANQVAGISMDELYLQGLAATLKSKGVEINLNGLKAESAEKLRRLQARVVELDGKLQEIRKKQEEMAGKMQNEQASAVEQLASMVITGAVVVNSWEALKDGNYECAVVTVWSPAQERFIRSVIGFDNDPVKLKPTTGKTVNEYANRMAWENVAGGRWIVDRDGVPHLFAVGAYELQNNNPSTLERAASFAEADAMLNLALTLQADVEFQQAAKRKVQNLRDNKGGDDSQAAESLAKEVSASVKDLKLQGVSSIKEDIRQSPFSTRQLYVKVLEFNPLSKKSAEEIFRSQRDAAVDVGRAQQELKGYIDESRAQIDAARRDASQYAKGQGKAATEVQYRKNAQDGVPAGQSVPQSSYDSGRLRNNSMGDAGEEDFKF